jgi:hypothetical protein
MLIEIQKGKSMKKLSLLVTLLGCATLSAEIKEKKSSQTFYSMQPLFNVGNKMAGAGRLSLFSLDHSANVYAAGVVTQSYNSASMSKFFLFNNQSSLVIRGSAHGDYSANTTDVRADWLGLPTNFEGTLNLAPSFESWGIALRFKKSLATMIDISFLKRCALFLEIPVVHTKTNLAFTQSSVSNAGATTSAVYDILTAFNNTTWNYQKISKTAQETTRLAELRLGLSNTFLASDRALVGLSSALSIPTTKQYANTYMFEPQGGHNGHPGMVSTVHIAVPLTLENSSTHFSFFVDAEHTFLFRTKQHRTFDLKDKPWSRFLLLREKDQTTNTTIPGVNILTRNVRISP